MPSRIKYVLNRRTRSSYLAIWSDISFSSAGKVVKVTHWYWSPRAGNNRWCQYQRRQFHCPSLISSTIFLLGWLDCCSSSCPSNVLSHWRVSVEFYVVNGEWKWPSLLLRFRHLMAACMPGILVTVPLLIQRFQFWNQPRYLNKAVNPMLLVSFGLTRLPAEWVRSNYKCTNSLMTTVHVDATLQWVNPSRRHLRKKSSSRSRLSLWSKGTVTLYLKHAASLFPRYSSDTICFQHWKTHSERWKAVEN
jgi:hypothetical protein